MLRHGSSNVRTKAMNAARARHWSRDKWRLGRGWAGFDGSTAPAAEHTRRLAHAAIYGGKTQGIPIDDDSLD
jgi:hypothetical protein